RRWSAKAKAAAPFSAAAPELKRLRRLAEVVRNVVERRVQLVADALHRANRRNGDESCNQAVLDGGRALFVTDQLKKLAHGLRSLVPSSDGKPPLTLHCPLAGCPELTARPVEKVLPLKVAQRLMPEGQASAFTRFSG